MSREWARTRRHRELRRHVDLDYLIANSFTYLSWGSLFIVRRVRRLSVTFTTHSEKKEFAKSSRRLIIIIIIRVTYIVHSRPKLRSQVPEKAPQSSTSLPIIFWVFPTWGSLVAHVSHLRVTFVIFSPFFPSWGSLLNTPLSHLRVTWGSLCTMYSLFPCHMAMEFLVYVLLQLWEPPRKRHFICCVCVFCVFVFCGVSCVEW